MNMALVANNVGLLWVGVESRHFRVMMVASIDAGGDQAA
jgi:hypothetical protein